MKTSLSAPSLLAMILVLAVVSGPALGQSRAKLWENVEAAVKAGLPKTAIKHLQPIIDSAIKEKKYGEAIRAISKRIALEGTIQGNKAEEKITRLQAEIAKAPVAMKPVLTAVEANWYWHYFRQNRWRFLRRSATAEAPGKDFTTWDLPRLFATIDEKFSDALSHQAVLKKIPVSDYDGLLAKGSTPDAYRPTLYDFLAHNALEFYNTGEQVANRSQDAFDLLAAGPIFAPVDDFLQWRPKSKDGKSLKLKAIRIYQELLRFHKDDKNPAAFIDANLLRLRFGFNHAFGEEKNQRFKSGLRRLVQKWSKHRISSRARFHIASTLRAEGDLVAAHAVATKGKKAFPASPGAAMCHNLIVQIEAKSAFVTAERVWNQPRPSIQVRYRNLDKVYFRVVKYDWKELLRRKSYQVEELSPKEKAAILRRGKVALSFEHDLPVSKDYQEQVETIPAPQDLAPGFYFLFSSHDRNFREQNNLVQATAFWVSDLALVVRTRYGSAGLEGFVLNAISGEPVANARVRSWNRTYNTSFGNAVETKTDKNGLFRIAGVNRRYFVLHVQRGKHAMSSYSSLWIYQANNRKRPPGRTIFFTDRRLYRPGQTIHYKGICIHVNQENDNYKAIPGAKAKIVFYDRNNKVIERRTVQANDYGSFSGSFTAPRDRLTGRMAIRVDGTPAGGVSFRVEEYKRPKFEVSLRKPEQGTKLNDKVSLTGKATAYTGAAIGGAEVRYRVVRQVRYPYWWGRYYWYRRPIRNASQEIAHGRTRTAGNGTFTISFQAKPDISVPASDEPIFQYRIYADVTDTNGETRSANDNVSVGYSALSATVSATKASWLTDIAPTSFTVRTTTLDGQPEAAEGTIRILRVKQPESVVRAKIGGYYYRPRWRKGQAPPKPDLSNPNSWPDGAVVHQQGFSTPATGTRQLSIQLREGMYRVLVETQDRFGKKVTARTQLEVLNPKSNRFSLKVPSRLAAPSWTHEPGEEFNGLWGSGYQKARAFVEIEHRRRVIKSYWTDGEKTQIRIRQAIKESMRGGFTVRVTFVRENRAYVQSRKVYVPWTNKQLKVKWERFVSKLEPAQKETWTAVVTGPNAGKAIAEMVATLYDASLDAYAPHNWQQHFGVFRQDYSNLNSVFQNVGKTLRRVHGGWSRQTRSYRLTYRTFPSDVTTNFWRYMFPSRTGKRAYDLASPAKTPASRRAKGEAKNADGSADGKDGYAESSRANGLNRADKSGQSGPDLSKVAARKNLNETAYFFPHLISNKKGEVRLEFVMPEALTKWKFMGFAHDTDLRAGFLQDSVVTAKELMVQPNPPRFVREGDVLEFTVKVSNQSAAAQKGKVRLSLSDARSLKSVDAELGNRTLDLDFDIPSKESRSYSWKLKVPDDMPFLTYKAVGSTGRLSDGEQGYLPVLSRRVLVSESLPLPIRGRQTKDFEFTRLLASKDSQTIRHKNVTVQMVSQPAWYAVMSLPYLMEYPYHCSEQTFNRLYANALARHIAKSNPKIRRIFDQWKNTPALDSPLEKNEDLKSVMLQETPWLRQAKNESQARRNVGILFDDNRLERETRRLLAKLGEVQLQNGGFPWFPGGPTNDYITLYITTGFGRMRHLGVPIDTKLAIKALGRLDWWINDHYRRIVNKELNHLTPRIALYLYCRSFFLDDKPIPASSKEAVAYFQGQARRFWLKLNNRQSQAHLALAMKRFGDPPTARKIMASIKERSVSTEELGMFWRELELSWWWYRAPIETQAMMIEAFDEVMNDAEAVEECKVWLLKQKQTQDWKTTKATADAVYALLIRGDNLLSSDALVEVALGGETIKPEKVEAGTGFYEKRFSGGDISPKLGQVMVKKTDGGVSWGSIHWQYLEDINKITKYDGTPLKLNKRLYIRKHTKSGPVITPVKGAVQVGDEVVVRVELRVDRDMEYVHLKDHRGSGTEPVNVLSRYRYQDGLRYYETTRDTASHFFIDYLPKGVYVFEYSTRVVHRGRYQTGMASVQCMYAPEFNSHSKSIALEAR